MLRALPVKFDKQCGRLWQSFRHERFLLCKTPVIRYAANRFFSRSHSPAWSSSRRATMITVVLSSPPASFAMMMRRSDMVGRSSDPLRT